MNKIFGLAVALCAAVPLLSCGGSETAVSRLQSVRPLQITSGTPPAGTYFATYGASSAGFTLAAAGGTAPYTWSWTAAAGSLLPPGLGLVDNVISGTPTALGTFNVVVTVTDSATPPKQNSSAYTITVTVGKLMITTGSFPSGVIGSRYNRVCVQQSEYGCRRISFGLQLQASGGVPSYTWNWVAATGSSLPPGLDLSAGGLLGGTPTLAGSYHVVVTVNDAQSPPAEATASFTLLVNNPPPPSINTNPPPLAGALNLPYVFTFSASGFGPLTWSKSGPLPPGLAFGADGTLAGTPTKLGSYPVSVTVTDGVGQVSAPDDVTIDVFPHGFKATGSMATVRAHHTATRLNNGKVLVTGGVNSTDPGATTELYDPASGSFAPTGSMGSTRAYHTATLLNGGKVLVTGGIESFNNPSATAELYDLASGSFASAGSLGTARTGHTATLLSDGKVLVTGGLSDTAELFDPTTAVFTATGKMSTPRTSHTATLLTNGKVLVTGGTDANGASLETAELYDPASGSFTSTGTMGTVRIGHTATLLTDGKVLVAGGGSDTAELFDSSTGTFTAIGKMSAARGYHTATLLADGKVLVTGGLDPDERTLALAELCDEPGTSFAGTGSLTSGRSSHTATILNDGRVLVTGGVDASGTLGTAELYQ
jgi:WD40 repeat protein